jgi:uncharacterized RDD family membrane protein YckC
MTQSPDHPEEPTRPPEATPPEQAAPVGGASAPPPLPTAPPISEPYGAHPSGPEGEYAGRGQRLLAAIIDGIITGAIGWIIATPFVGVGAMYGTKHLGARLGANLITTIVAIVYYALQHGKWGQTLGKRALGIRVVLADGGGPIAYGAAFGRVVFTYAISLVTCGIGGIVDAAWILGDQRRQALHDKVVRTVVVRADGPDPYASR